MADVARLKRENGENERNAIEKLLADDDFTDVTLVSKDGAQVGAHRAVLGNASTFLRSLLLESQHQNTFLYLGMVADRQVLSLYLSLYVLLSFSLLCLCISFVFTLPLCLPLSISLVYPFSLSIIRYYRPWSTLYTSLTAQFTW